MIPGSVTPLLLKKAAVDTGYNIERSLRFNSSDSAFLSRTPASAGNRKTWTWAGWVKRSGLGSGDQTLMNSGNALNADLLSILFRHDYLLLADAARNRLATSALFRDTSAWYHIVVAVDTTLANADDRQKIYVNGAQVTAFAARDNFTQNADTGFSGAIVHSIGRDDRTGARHFNGYLADVIFVDGQQLDPSSFVEVSATTGQLLPRQFTGSFGTNGFWLKFSDNSNNTATTLGKDYSPNGNNWTPNNLSVTAGAGNDSLVDTPTSYNTDDGLGGSVRGNYCTWNPLENQLNLTNGNLDVDRSTNTWASCKATIGLASGKWYYEYTVNSGSSNQIIGVFQTSAALPAAGASGYMTVSASGWGYQLDGNKSNANSFTSTGTTAAAGDVLMVAFDVDAGRIWFGKNGTWIGSGAPASGTNAAFTNLSGTISPAVCLYGAQSGSVNFGARAFAYTAPSGFRPLVDTCLPAPVVAKPSEVMDVKLYTGNGGTQTISGLGFGPDFVWLKRRDAARNHALYDIVRGVKKYLASDSTSAEYEPASGGVSSFDASSFTVVEQGGVAINESSASMVAWTWDAGSSTVTNTQGSITSQVRANASAGFSIVTYTGTLSSSPGTAPTVGHGLGVKPALIISKSRNNAGIDSGAWYVNHGYNYNNYLRLNTTAAEADISTNGGGTEADPTNTVFSTYYLSGSNINANNYVAYCFAPVAGYSNGFSYTGNGSTDGSFVYLGFRPRLILLKCSSTTGNWTLLDTAREGYNVDNDPLYPNLSNAEGTTDLLDITSNGFKLRTTDASVNSSGATYVGYAWAEAPFAYSRAR